MASSSVVVVVVVVVVVFRGIKGVHDAVNDVRDFDIQSKKRGGKAFLRHPKRAGPPPQRRRRITRSKKGVNSL